MNTMTPVERILSVISMIGMLLLVAMAVTRFSELKMFEWIGLLALWLVPAMVIVFLKPRKDDETDT